MGNCLFFAIKKFWEEKRGYIAFRRSKFGPWFHFIYVRDLKDADIEHFVPDAERLKFEAVNKIWFKGHVKTHERPHKKELAD